MKVMQSGRNSKNVLFHNIEDNELIKKTSVNSIFISASFKSFKANEVTIHIKLDD